MLKLMDIEKKSNIHPTLKFTLHIKNLLSESLFSSNFQSPKINYLLKKTPIDFGNLFLLLRYLLFPIREIITL